jgi:hypothetical protein
MSEGDVRSRATVNLWRFSRLRGRIADRRRDRFDRFVRRLRHGIGFGGIGRVSRLGTMRLERGSGDV